MFRSRLLAGLTLATLVLGFRAEINHSILAAPRVFLSAAVTGLTGFLLLSLYYHAVYGSYLGPQIGALTAGEADAYAWSVFPVGLYGLLLSPGTGLFVYQPWLVFLFLAPGLPSGGLPPHWRKALLALSLSQLLLYSGFRHWDGQWCWGSRYLSEVIPLLALALLPNLARALSTAGGRRLAQICAAIAFLIHLNGTSIAGTKWQSNPKDPNASMDRRSLDWSDPAFLYPLPRWLSGGR